MKNIAWHLVSTQLVLALVIITRSSLYSNLRAEVARKVLPSKSSPLYYTRPWSACYQYWASFHIQNILSLSPSTPPSLPKPLFLCSGISHPENPGHRPTLVSPSLLLCLMPTFPGNPGFREQLQLLSRLAAAAQKQGSMVQQCSLSGLILFFHLSLKNLFGCANCGRSVSCPLCVPDASA